MKMKYLLINVIILICISLKCNCQPEGYEYIKIYTPHGTFISNPPPGLTHKFIGTDFNSEEIEYIRYGFEVVQFPNKLVYVSPPTKKYNCHAYAWYMTSPVNGDEVWINNNADNKFWEDESFVESVSVAGAKVSYNVTDACDHSAIRTDDPNLCISKWNDGPVYIHALLDCPYCLDPQNVDPAFFIACDPTEIQNHVYGSDDEITGCEIQILDEVKITGSNTDVIFEAPYIEITGDFYVCKGPTIELKNP